MKMIMIEKCSRLCGHAARVAGWSTWFRCRHPNAPQNKHGNKRNYISVRGFDWDAWKGGAFPKWCPLKDAPEVGKAE